jgi:hypothetical protein
MRFRARSQLTSTHGIARRRRPLTALTSAAPASRSRPATAYQGHWPDARTAMRPPIGRCDGVRPPRQLGAPSTRVEATEDPKINSCRQNWPPRPRTSTRPSWQRRAQPLASQMSRAVCRPSALGGFSTLSSLAQGWGQTERSLVRLAGTPSDRAGDNQSCGGDERAIATCYSAAVRMTSGATAGRRISSHSAEITADISAKAASE